jgi:hypothetical protein
MILSGTSFKIIQENLKFDFRIIYIILDSQIINKINLTTSQGIETIFSGIIAGSVITLLDSVVSF